ncbi:hypothetical protein J2Z21_001340 [Streptomyces griseochromogenes]|uniref:Uncharacterized protein n=1 Tax=Streptomyces griseochromogenes TaxID=68214 RepID=A0ABS4LLZ5_9ACTN|nr:hypothetical protein [Streptomyces griseochromogenes]MBP2048416.1 hypothetical protein [Streptomyces griseochromogenes]
MFSGQRCGGSLELGLGPVTEVGYNALHNRPAGSNNLFVAWETLTHGDNPD